MRRWGWAFLERNKATDQLLSPKTNKAWHDPAALSSGQVETTYNPMEFLSKPREFVCGKVRLLRAVG